jgi:hypothetical protein
MSEDIKAHRQSIISFPQAMMDYFGKTEKGIQGFMTELKALNDTDKFDFRMMLREIGYNV